MRRLKFLLLLVAIPVLLTGCLSPRVDSPLEKRSAIDGMSRATLDELYQQRPAARANIERADGYAVFSNVNAQYFLLGGGGGYGVAVDRNSGRKTYMKMAQASLGLGLGVQDVRVVFVFHSPAALDAFVHRGWEFGGQADLAAKAEDKGVAASGELSISPEVGVYTLTKSGLVAKINLAGSKYWQDAELN